MKPIGNIFMKATYRDQVSPSPQDQGAPQPPLELPIDPHESLIPLPAPKGLEIPEIGLRQAVDQRRTRRRYREEPLSQAELSYLLWMTQGVQRVTARPATLRTVPSAGARHAFETYLMVNRVAGIEPGLYRFAASQHALLRTEAPATIQNDIYRACYEQKQVQVSAVTFLWVAVVERMAWRYVERGYRYLHLDAGHVCQNLYLAAEAVNCGVCAIAAFDDEQLNRVLDLDGENVFVIYLASLGKKQEAE